MFQYEIRTYGRKPTLTNKYKKETENNTIKISIKIQWGYRI